MVSYILSDRDFDAYEQWHHKNYTTDWKMALPLDEAFKQLRKQWMGRDIYEWASREPLAETNFQEWLIYQLRLKMEWIMFPELPALEKRDEQCTCLEEEVDDDDVERVCSRSVEPCDYCKSKNYVHSGYDHPPLE